MDIEDEVFYFSCYPPIHEPEKFIKHLIDEVRIVERMTIIIEELKNSSISGMLVNRIFEVERLMKLNGFSSREIEVLFDYVQNECVEKGYMNNEEFTDLMMCIFGERVTERWKRLNKIHERPIVQWSDNKSIHYVRPKGNIIEI